MLPNLNRGTDRLVTRFDRRVERIAFTLNESRSISLLFISLLRDA
jgi:hypothetical protein